MFCVSCRVLSCDCRLGLPPLSPAEKLSESLSRLFGFPLEGRRVGTRGLEQELLPSLGVYLPEQLVDPPPVQTPVVAAGHAASWSSTCSTSSTCSRAGRRKTPTMTIAATSRPPRTSSDVWKPFTAAGALVAATE